MKNLFKISLIVFVAAFFCAGLFDFAATAQRKPRIFSHNTPAHKQGKYKDCNFCHQLPTKNWTAPRKDGLQPFPDVRNFPYKNHTVCNTCHANEVFSSGAIFCGSCHVDASQRARAVLPFPNKSHPTQFTTIFPHDRHQDIIASNRQTTDYAVAHFIQAAFTMADDKPRAAPYNCAICHQTLTQKQTPKYEIRAPFGVKPLSGPVSGTDADADKFASLPVPAPTPDPQHPGYVPLNASYFKSSPGGHDSCFTCHYQFQNLPPGKQDCSGCHALAKPYYDKDIIRRYSLRFNHEREGHTGDCTSCHIRITQSDDVRKKNAEGVPIVADVPLVTCKKCHETGEDVPFKQIISGEIKKREASVKAKQPAFQCVYCHTAPISRYDIPSSHRNP